MRRLKIKHSLTQGGQEIVGGDNGMPQIIAFARKIGLETGESIVHFEIYWPGQSVEGGIWDAVRVDLTKVDANDPADWWITTLPPYEELTPKERASLGIAL